MKDGAVTSVQGARLPVLPRACLCAGAQKGTKQAGLVENESLSSVQAGRDMRSMNPVAGAALGIWEKSEV